MCGQCSRSMLTLRMWVLHSVDQSRFLKPIIFSFSLHLMQEPLILFLPQPVFYFFHDSFFFPRLAGRSLTISPSHRSSYHSRCVVAPMFRHHLRPCTCVSVRLFFLFKTLVSLPLFANQVWLAVGAGQERRDERQAIWFNGLASQLEFQIYGQGLCYEFSIENTEISS